MSLSLARKLLVALTLVTLATPAFAQKATKKGVRERIMTREARGKFTKGADQRNLNFEEAAIGGTRRDPMASVVSQNQADKNYDFVKIRLRWHGEMFQSASSLDTN